MKWVKWIVDGMASFLSSALWSRHLFVLALCLALFGALWLNAAPVAAQELPVDASLLAQLHAARAAQSTDAPPEVIAPPLPLAAPQVGPLVKPEPEPILATNTSVAGWTGYALGSSPIGSGPDIIRNPEDIETRSTAIELSLIQASDTFEFPDVTEQERWIRVDVGNQQVVAYEGQKPVRAFIVSTGLPNTPTVTGEFRIRMKVSQQTMSGADYYLPGVKWVMYFYDEYAFHGTYWHDNFGNPMSHGCVNMTNADAQWLFDWAGPEWDGETVWFPSTAENPGTLVAVHE